MSAPTGEGPSVRSDRGALPPPSSAPGRRRDGPVRRGAALVGLLLAVAAVAALVASIELLRLPPLGGPIPEPESDPREEVTCSVRLATTPRAPGTSGALQVTSNDLYACPATYDAVLVRYEGEAVGALLRREDGTWAQLNDDAYGLEAGPLVAHQDFRGGNAGIGVLLRPGDAAQISAVGGPDTRGDVLEVTGVFRRIHEPTGEVAVIEALDAQVVRSGEPIERPTLPDRRLAAWAALLAAVALTVAERVAARRR